MRMLSLCLLLCAVMALTGATSDPGPCFDPKRVGMCRAAFPRWHYSPASQTCEHFTYGGCGANRNNFQSREECVGACGRFSTRSDPCKEPKTVGPCRAEPRWYFNAASNKCQRFMFGGCMANGNNFSSKSECVNTCLPHVFVPQFY